MNLFFWRSKFTLKTKKLLFSRALCKICDRYGKTIWLGFISEQSCTSCSMHPLKFKSLRDSIVYCTFYRGRGLRCGCTGFRGHGGRSPVWNEAVVLFLTLFNFLFHVWIVINRRILPCHIILLVQIFLVTILGKFPAFFIFEVEKFFIEVFSDGLYRQYDL